jgi:hypothetical protein
MHGKSSRPIMFFRPVYPTILGLDHSSFFGGIKADKNAQEKLF